MTAQPTADPRRILLRVPNWLGDAVISLPALRKLRERFPAAELVALARPSVADVYRNLPEVARVIVFEHRGRHRGWTGRWRLARELRREQFDLAVLFQNAFEAALLAWLAGIPQRVGYARDARGPLLTRAVPVPRAGEIPWHEAYYYLELLRRAGWLEALPLIEQVDLAPPAAAVEDMRRRLRDLGLLSAAERRLLTVICPGAAFGSAKCWLPERFAALADRLVEARNAVVLLCGTSAEAPLGEAIATHMRAKPISLMGQTTLEELWALLSLADVFIGNDSGAMHLAAGVGLPQVDIFGPTDESGTGPLSPAARIVKREVPCSPCFLRHCPVDHRCMTGVSVDYAWAAVEDVLTARDKSRASSR